MFAHIFYAACFLLLVNPALSAQLVVKAPADCFVTKIIKVHAGDIFTCKVHKAIAPVPVRVSVLGLKPLPQAGSLESAIEFTGSVLKAAKTIDLKNIRMRNYFRLRADVYVDGKNLAELLVANNFFQMDETMIPPKPEQSEKSTSVFRSRVAGRGKPRSSFKKSEVEKIMLQTLGPNWRNALIQAQLKKLVDVSDIRPEMTFDEALDILRNSVRPALPIVVLWRDLEENSFVDKTTPVGIECNGAILLKKVLELMLISVGGGTRQLGYAIDGGILTITTKQLALVNGKSTKVYDITELTGAPADYITAIEDIPLNYFFH